MASIRNEASDRANSEQLSRALGEAVVRIWGLLPPDVQQHLFEEASSHGADTRTQLALFLHGTGSLRMMLPECYVDALAGHHARQGCSPGSAADNSYRNHAVCPLPLCNVLRSPLL